MWYNVIMPPSKKEGHIALHVLVSMSVFPHLVQLITQECFAPQTSHLVGRKSLMSGSVFIFSLVGKRSRPFSGA